MPILYIICSKQHWDARPPVPDLPKSPHEPKVLYLNLPQRTAYSPPAGDVIPHLLILAVTVVPPVVHTTRLSCDIESERTYCRSCRRPSCALHCRRVLLELLQRQKVVGRMSLWRVPMWVVCVEVIGVHMIGNSWVEVERIHHGLMMVMSGPAEPLPVANNGGVPFQSCARKDNTRIRDAY